MSNPRSAREAGVIATWMTARCHEIFEAANAWAAMMKEANQSSADFSALLDAVVDACKKGIENARAKPDTALAFANNL